MPQQFVFVAGHSAAGKKTFIEKVFGNEGVDLRERFRLSGQMERFGPDFDPTNRAITSKADTVLIKWQFMDHYWIEVLKKRVPSAQHRVILLWKPFDDHLADLMARQAKQGRIEWKPGPGELEREWYEKLVPLFGDIHLRGIRCELVHGRTHEPLTDWP
jgi:hypothetical protein